MTSPIELHYWPTPNGWKISIMLEECGLPYTLKPVNIGKGEQFEPSFLAIAPNNRMPAIVDHSPADGGAAIALRDFAELAQQPGFLRELFAKLNAPDDAGIARIYMISDMLMIGAGVLLLASAAIPAVHEHVVVVDVGFDVAVATLAATAATTVAAIAEAIATTAPATARGGAPRK